MALGSRGAPITQGQRDHSRFLQYGSTLRGIEGMSVTDANEFFFTVTQEGSWEPKEVGFLWAQERWPRQVQEYLEAHADEDVVRMACKRFGIHLAGSDQGEMNGGVVEHTPAHSSTRVRPLTKGSSASRRRAVTTGLPAITQYQSSRKGLRSGARRVWSKGV